MLFEDLDSLGVLHLYCDVVRQRLEIRVQHQDTHVYLLPRFVDRLVRLQKQDLGVHNADLRQVLKPLSLDLYLVFSGGDPRDLDGNRAGPCYGGLGIGYRTSAAHQGDFYIALRGLLSLEQGDGYTLKLA